MIQIINFNGKADNYAKEQYRISSLQAPLSLDEFNINIIDLSNSDIWRFDGNKEISVNCANHLQSIKTMVKERTKSSIIIILPQNLNYNFNRQYTHSGYAFVNSKELKDMIESLSMHILPLLFDGVMPTLIYENTRTKFDKNSVAASFYFKTSNGDSALTKSIGSEKVTTIKTEDIIITTLKIMSETVLMDFLEYIGLCENSITIPEWMEGIKMFDDNKQISVIQENNDIIKSSQENINQALKVIEKNNEYKSILFTNGDDLVEVVFSILKEMLGCDLSNFKDDKKEDFLFEINDYVYIGEIKGINSSVKSENVSQLDVHYQGYIDENTEVRSDKVRAILIINHQRNKSIENREPVNIRQIELAKRNGSLIVETITLLRLFEKYLSGDITRADCLSLLTENTGLLQL